MLIVGVMIVMGCQRTWGIENPTYYFPEIETYMRLMPSSSGDSLYILISKEERPELSNASDYIRVGKMMPCSQVFLRFNPDIDEIVVTVDDYPPKADLHLTHYSVVLINHSYSQYYDYTTATGYLFKLPFYGVCIYSDQELVSTQINPETRWKTAFPIEYKKGLKHRFHDFFSFFVKPLFSTDVVK